MRFVIFLILGGLTGMFGRNYVSGQGYGLVPDVVVGVVGGLVGGWLGTLIFGSGAVGLVIGIVIAVGAACGLVAVVHSVKASPASS